MRNTGLQSGLELVHERQSADVLGDGLDLLSVRRIATRDIEAKIIVALAALEVRQLIDHVVGLLSRQTRIAERSGEHRRYGN